MPRARKSKTAPPPELRKAAIYVRVSTKEQQEGGFSLEAQGRLLEEYCERNGFLVVARYSEAETAKKSGRTEFNAMLKAARRQGITDIVVEKTDRAYRNLADRVKIADLGVDLHLVKENEIVGPRSRSHSKFVHDIKVVMAKNVIDNMTEEIVKGMREKAMEGIWPSWAPVGYLNVHEGPKKTISLDEERAPWIRRAFEMYAAGGTSLKEVAAFLNANGITKSRKGRFTPSSLHIVLTNPLYKGMIRWNGEEYPGRHEPLVSPAVWERCQQVMAGRNPNEPGNVSGSQGDFAYRGLIRCAVCGCMVGPYEVIKKGKEGAEPKRYVYYACSGARGCKRTPVREEVITGVLAETLDQLRLRESVMDLLREALREGHAERTKDVSEQRAALLKRVAGLKAKLTAMYEDKLSNSVPEDIWRGLWNRTQGEISEAEALLEATDRAEMRSWEQDFALLQAVNEAGDRFRAADTATKEEIAKRMVSNLLTEGKEVRVELRSWFRTILEANERCGLNPALESTLR